MADLLRCSSICEYVSLDGPFYHITPSKNRSTILEKGLLAGTSVHAICVVRSNDHNVIHTIASSQLSGDGDMEFILIKLTPSKHKFGVSDIEEDYVSEITAPLHNYIRKDCIPIDEDDIIDTFYVENTDCPSPDKIIKLEYDCH